MLQEETGVPGALHHFVLQRARDTQRLQPECGVKSEFAACLLDRELAVILGDVVDARRAARDSQERGVGGGIGGERARTTRPAGRPNLVPGP